MLLIIRRNDCSPTHTEGMEILNTKYKCESVRLCRFLYSLGFDKESKYDENGNEYWLFERSQCLQKSLDFFFSTRKQINKQRSNK